ncbi:hypothetical protein, conserved [Eimeria tenella]|uniref:Protein kinase domain-containing protein n=1 Tax=Eimeria tenella TaxID=5802 RepID=U6L3N1_EIMTE|nr:hypothetical protein, conserved [Eimeria tenella]CDJ42375.1 hypothetical protein, conserved [Eimeria tenella]|eukprot:XP_013233125.1 hypothetical protein, conserved [Eimeria tenella]
MDEKQNASVAGARVETNLDLRGVLPIADSHQILGFRSKQHYLRWLYSFVAGLICFIVIRGNLAPHVNGSALDVPAADAEHISTNSSSLVSPSQDFGDRVEPDDSSSPADDFEGTPPAVQLIEGGPWTSILLGGDSSTHMPDHDIWGAPSLEKFENALPPQLQRSKDAIAAWTAQFYASDNANEYAEALQRMVAEAISSGTEDSLVGKTIDLRGIWPLNWRNSDGPLPHKMRIVKVVGVAGRALVVNAIDCKSRDSFSVHIPVISEDFIGSHGSEDALREVRRAADAAVEAQMQACGGVSAEQAASQKGIAVPLYTAEIQSLDELHSRERFYIFNRTELGEKVDGSLAQLRSEAPSVMTEARDYIASRLLHIVLKLEQSGVGHLKIDWSSFFLRGDGSFLLGNFSSASPFGVPTGNLFSSMSDYPEPFMMLSSRRSGLTTEAGTNLWSLGVLLFQLYTGEEHPYAVVEGRTWTERRMQLARVMLEQKVRSDVLLPKLEACNVPDPWKKVILRLLEPCREFRISGPDIVKEFPELIYAHPD